MFTSTVPKDVHTLRQSSWCDLLLKLRYTKDGESIKPWAEANTAATESIAITQTSGHCRVSPRVSKVKPNVEIRLSLVRQHWSALVQNDSAYLK